VFFLHSADLTADERQESLSFARLQGLSPCVRVTLLSCDDSRPAGAVQWE
jgi:hypothetical protein